MSQLPAALRLLRLAGAVLAAGGAAKAAETTILPGYWEYTTDSPGGKSTERRCLKGEDIARFVASPGNHRYHCSYPEQSLGGGRAHYRGVCTSKRHSFPMTLDGTYSPTGMDLSGRIRPVAGVPLDIPVAIRGRRLGPACPPS